MQHFHEPAMDCLLNTAMSGGSVELAASYTHTHTHIYMRYSWAIKTANRLRACRSAYKCASVAGGRRRHVNDIDLHRHGHGGGTDCITAHHIAPSSSNLARFVDGSTPHCCVLMILTTHTQTLCRHALCLSVCLLQIYSVSLWST